MKTIMNHLICMLCHIYKQEILTNKVYAYILIGDDYTAERKLSIEQNIEHTFPNLLIIVERVTRVANMLTELINLLNYNEKLYKFSRNR